MAEERSGRIFLKTLACIFAFVIAIVVGFYGYFIINKPIKDESDLTGSGPGTRTIYGSNVKVQGDLSMHFMMLGNGKSGDCIYIKAGDTDILVDGGSETDSLDAICSYVDEYVTDGKIEYAIVTHADSDHIACFGGTTKAGTSLFDHYKFGTIIDFALSDKDTQIYNRYITKRDKEVSEDGAKHYTALQCWNNDGGAKREYEIANGISIEILYHEFYEKRDPDENNYSVCFMINQSDEYYYLFTGDLEEDGEASLVEHNDLPEVDFYKAGHHGSKTSSNDVLLSVIKPKVSVACCAAGSVQYTKESANTFPTQAYIDRISKYTDKVYVPTYVDVYTDNEGKLKDGEYHPLNGNIVINANSTAFKVSCSHDISSLKNTQWFKTNRITPSYWAA